METGGGDGSETGLVMKKGKKSKTGISACVTQTEESNNNSILMCSTSFCKRNLLYIFCNKTESD